jgi:hypothetical protein
MGQNYWVREHYTFSIVGYELALYRAFECEHVTMFWL